MAGNPHASPAPELYEWHYLANRGRTHARKRRSAGLDHVAQCGISPQWFDPTGWLGTGSQVEYERAANLPRCRRCVRLTGGSK